MVDYLSLRVIDRNSCVVDPEFRIAARKSNAFIRDVPLLLSPHQKKRDDYVTTRTNSSPE
jgi:hypothetical protein